MKILLKIFKSNLSNCILCFVSSVLVSAMVFLFEGIRILVLSSLDEYDRMHSSIGIAVQTYIFMLLFAGFILVMYTVNSYSRVRIRDYGMFMILGGEKGNVIRMVLVEYGIICGISYMIGCAAGTLLLSAVQYVFKTQEIVIRLGGSAYMKIAGISFLYILLIFTIAAGFNLYNLLSRSLSGLMSFQEKKSRFPSVRWSAAGAAAGTVCMIITVVMLLKPPVTYLKVRACFILFLCGTYLLFTCLGSLILGFLKKRESWYNRYLLKVKNLYYRFSESKNLVMIVFVINIFVLVFVNINVVRGSGDVRSSKYSWKYPYDYVWMTEERYADTIKHAVSGSESGTNLYPYTKITTHDGGEYIGIPESSYEELTGKEEHIDPGEIVSIIEKAEYEEDKVFAEGPVYLQEGGKIKEFRLKREFNEIILAGYVPALIEVVVMNDEDFAAMKDSREDAGTILITQKVPENTQAVEKSLSMTAQDCGAFVFGKKSLIRQDCQKELTALIFYVCLGIFLIISNMTILAIKVWSEIPLLSGKYSFLQKIGMDEKEMENHIKGELSVYLKIPFMLSVAIGGIAAVCMLKGSEQIVILEASVMFLFLTAAQALYIAGMRRYGYWLINGRLNREGK